MNTFEIKLTVLTILGSKADVEKAKPIYDWIMEEVEVDKGEDKKPDSSLLQ